MSWDLGQRRGLGAYCTRRVHRPRVQVALIYCPQWHCHIRHKVSPKGYCSTVHDLTSLENQTLSLGVCRSK